MTARRVEIDEEKIRAIAEYLRSRAIPSDQEDAPLLGFSPEVSSNFWLVLVAICHQTSPTGRPPLEGMVRGVFFRGWDFLRARFEDLCRDEPEILDPAVWPRVRGEALTNVFGPQLTDPAGRAALINDLGAVMPALGVTSLLELADRCHARIADGSPNLLASLARFKAYDDPVRKKSYFLLSLLRNSGLVKFEDSEHLGPPVDYHEVRGHLRIGTVRIVDAGLLNAVIAGTHVSAEDDIAIREAVHDAILMISKRAPSLTPSTLHYLFWNVFRTHCTRQSPKCAFEETRLPERYLHLNHELGVAHCPFVKHCAAFQAKSFVLRDHVCDTEYY